MAGYGRLEQEDLIEGLNIWPLKKSGLWGIFNHYRETGERSRTLKIWITITILVFSPLVVTSILGPFFTAHDLEGITLTLLNPMSVVQLAIKSSVIWYGLEIQCRILEVMRKDFLTCVPLDKMAKTNEILRECAEQSNFLTRLCVTVNSSTVSIWNILPILRSEFFRLTLGITVFGTPLRDNKILGFWYPVNINLTPWTEIIYVYEAFVCFWAGYMITLMEVVIAQLVILLTAQIKVFNYLMNDLTMSEEPHRDTENLLDYVKEHQKLMKVGDDMKDLYNFLITMTLVTGLVILIISIFNFILGSGNGDIVLMIKFVSFTMYPLAEVAVYCYAGGNLETVSGEVTFAAYGSEWYRMGGEYRRTLQMIMVRSRNALTLKAGKLYPVNLTALTNILQMAYSTSMLMYRMTNSD